MARAGVSFDQVAAIADGLVAEAVSPTLKNVRERLATGSFGTIHRHLKAWQDLRPLPMAASIELPESIIHAICSEIDRAKAFARVEVEERLVLTQAEGDELAVFIEMLESELYAQEAAVKNLTADKCTMNCKLQELSNEIELLRRENERERYTAEQARIEVAQLRNKLDLQMEKLVEQAALIDKILNEQEREHQARIAAERDAAVLSSQVETEREKAIRLSQENEEVVLKLQAERQQSELGRIALAKIDNALESQRSTLSAIMKEKEELSALFDAERKLAEANRIECARVTHLLEFKTSALAEKTAMIKSLSGDVETEKNARLHAETKVAVLMSQLKAINDKQPHLPSPT
jgi:colicin import membrane protein